MFAPYPKRRRWCGAWFCLILLPIASVAAPAPDDTTAAWQLMADHLVRDASIRLDQIKGTPTREQVFAQAVVAVDYQPVTQDRLQQAEATFATLARGDDEIAEAAAYMQARLYQVHFQRPDYGRAAALYRALAERHPESHWAQLGLVKLSLLLLYALPEPAAPAERIAAANALLPRVHEEKLRRDLHLQIGRAGTFYEQPLDSVLPHLIEVNRIGGLVGQAPEDLAIELGELSLRAGHYEQARHYFEAYLRDFVPNLRSVTVRRRLEEIAALEAAKKDRP
ncbi:MAG: hypothetical protein ABI222_01105 [Opitutaceae bacterium]